MTRTKVCGLTTAADVRAAVEAGADAVGVVSAVDVETPREVAPDRAADLLTAAPPFVTTVLVTTTTAPERAVDLVGQVQPDAIQLHGGVTPGDLAYVSATGGAEVIRAVAADEPATALAHDDVADAVLLDTPSADGGGGTGRTHDWERAREVAADLDSPVVLAGGLTPANVARAVETVEPYAVDVATGVERDPGETDPEAVASFVENATVEAALA